MATYIDNIDRTECIGNSLPRINNNFDSLDTQLVTAETDIATLKQSVTSITERLDENDVFYNESTFTYGCTPANTVSKSQLGNQWVDLYTDTNKTPLSITVSSSTKKNLLLNARVHVRSVNIGTSTFVRLVKYADESFTVDSVLDIGSMEALVTYSIGSAINLFAVLPIEAGSTQYFGVQTYVVCGPTAKAGGAIIFNGWQLDDSTAEQTNNAKNTNSLKDIQAVNLYDSATNANPGANRMGRRKVYGYTNSTEAIEKEIKNISFIRGSLI